MLALLRKDAIAEAVEEHIAKVSNTNEAPEWL